MTPVEVGANVQRIALLLRGTRAEKRVARTDQFLRVSRRRVKCLLRTRTRLAGA